MTPLRLESLIVAGRPIHSACDVGVGRYARPLIEV